MSKFKLGLFFWLIGLGGFASSWILPYSLEREVFAEQHLGQIREGMIFLNLFGFGLMAMPQKKVLKIYALARGIWGAGALFYAASLMTPLLPEEYLIPLYMIEQIRAAGIGMFLFGFGFMALIHVRYGEPLIER